ncbi:MAG: hypothetical protein AAFN40_03505 [Cyanobacteria bacterium J06560_6]
MPTSLITGKQMTEAVKEKEIQQASAQAQSSSQKEEAELKAIQEIAIVVIAKGLNPTSFTPDFLVHSGIIPADWLLAQKPVVNQQMAQIVFQNGISLTAQPGKVTFSESIDTKTDEELLVAKLADKYIEVLPQANYVALGINPQKVEVFNERPQDVQTFMTKTLLQPNSWQDMGTQPMQASCNLFYQLENCRLQLSLNPTELRLPNDARVPGLLFSGNYHYELAAEGTEARTQEIRKALSCWQANLSDYRALIEDKFLALIG